MIIRYIVLLVGCILLLPVQGQSQIKLISQEVVSNHLGIAIAEVENQADAMLSKAELFPDDPEIEYGYLWGSPSFIGNRHDLSLTQRLKLPGYYKARKKFNSLELEKQVVEQSILKNETLYAALVQLLQISYLMDRQSLIKERLLRWQEIETLSAKRRDLGEGNTIELDKLKLMTLQSKQELISLISEERSQYLSLKQLNGNVEVKEYSSLVGDWIIMIENADNNGSIKNSPLYQNTILATQKASVQLKVSKKERLPDLQFGYRSEVLGTEKVAGAVLGLSIPIWGKSSKIQSAQLALKGKEMRTALMEQQLETHVDIHLERANNAKTILGLYNQALSENKSRDLLSRMYELGEISLQEFLLELPYYYQLEDKVLDAKRDFVQASLDKNRNWLSVLILKQENR